MATELDIPVVYTKTVTTQKIDKIIMDIYNNQVEVHIADYINSVELEPYSRKYYSEEFANIPDCQVIDDFRDVLVNVRAFARAKGLLGAGVDTDEIQ